MEATILLALQSLRLPVLTQLAALVSAFGNYAFIWVVIGICLLYTSGIRSWTSGADDRFSRSGFARTV